MSMQTPLQTLLQDDKRPYKRPNNRPCRRLQTPLQTGAHVPPIPPSASATLDAALVAAGVPPAWKGSAEGPQCQRVCDNYRSTIVFVSIIQPTACAINVLSALASGSHALHLLLPYERSPRSSDWKDCAFDASPHLSSSSAGCGGCRSAGKSARDMAEILPWPWFSNKNTRVGGGGRKKPDPSSYSMSPFCFAPASKKMGPGFGKFPAVVAVSG
jgi:hypothetical protein